MKIVLMCIFHLFQFILLNIYIRDTNSNDKEQPNRHASDTKKVCFLSQQFSNLKIIQQTKQTPSSGPPR